MMCSQQKTYEVKRPLQNRQSGYKNVKIQLIPTQQNPTLHNEKKADSVEACHRCKCGRNDT